MVFEVGTENPALKGFMETPVKFTPTRWKDRLLTVENAKTTKGELLGYKTGILYLAPASLSVPHGGGNLCPSASKGCEAVCLANSGRGRFNKVKVARMNKTLNFFNNRQAFLEDIRLSVKRIIRLAEKEGMKAAIRLNGTSDFPFESTGIMDEFPDCIFYDYSKRANRFFKPLPFNYHLTFSRSESNDAEVERIIKELPAVNIAVVFNVRKGKPLPKTYLGREVVDADLSDARYLDEKGVICGLRVKSGKGKYDTSGFVVEAGEYA